MKCFVIFKTDSKYAIIINVQVKTKTLKTLALFFYPSKDVNVEFYLISHWVNLWLGLPHNLHLEAN